MTEIAFEHTERAEGGLDLDGGEHNASALETVTRYRNDLAFAVRISLRFVDDDEGFVVVHRQLLVSQRSPIGVLLGKLRTSHKSAVTK